MKMRLLYLWLIFLSPLYVFSSISYEVSLLDKKIAKLYELREQAKNKNYMGLNNEIQYQHILDKWNEQSDFLIEALSEIEFDKINNKFINKCYLDIYKIMSMNDEVAIDEITTCFNTEFIGNDLFISIDITGFYSDGENSEQVIHIIFNYINDKNKFIIKKYNVAG